MGKLNQPHLRHLITQVLSVQSYLRRVNSQLRKTCWGVFKHIQRLKKMGVEAAERRTLTERVDQIHGCEGTFKDREYHGAEETNPNQNCKRIVYLKLKWTYSTSVQTNMVNTTWKSRNDVLWAFEVGRNVYPPWEIMPSTTNQVTHHFCALSLCSCGILHGCATQLSTGYHVVSPWISIKAITYINSIISYIEKDKYRKVFYLVLCFVFWWATLE